MKIHSVLCGAMLALALTSGCKREEPKSTTAPSPPTVPQPAEKPPTTSPQPGAAMPGEPRRSVGQTIDDATITGKVKAALLQSPDVKGLDVNVDTVSGKVTLKGSVDTQTQADRAVQIARSNEGVKDVDSQLMVKAKP